MHTRMILLLLAIALQQASAQDKPDFSVTLSTDTVLMGNYFELAFKLENERGDQFEPPDFKEFRVVGGPNQSSSFSIVNGEVSRSSSISYFLAPKTEGSFFIGPASIKAGEAILETPPVEVIVLPNPDGILQNPYQEELRQWPFSKEPLPQPDTPNVKKKRKTYRM